MSEAQQIFFGLKLKLYLIPCSCLIRSSIRTPKSTSGFSISKNKKIRKQNKF